MHFPLVIFDLDGTLVDSLPDIAAALNHALGEVGLAALTTVQVRGLVGEGVVKLAEKALRLLSSPLPTEVLAERVRAYYQAHPRGQAVLYPEVEVTLRALRARPGQRLAVLTNKPGEITRPLLAAMQIEGFFDAVIGDGDGHPRKPDPGAGRALLGRFGLEAAQALMVGDGLPDMAFAHALGAPAAAALWGYTPREDLLATGPRFALASPAGLLDLG